MSRLRGHSPIPPLTTPRRRLCTPELQVVVGLPGTETSGRFCTNYLSRDGMWGLCGPSQAPLCPALPSLLPIPIRSQVFLQFPGAQSGLRLLPSPGIGQTHSDCSGAVSRGAQPGLPNFLLSLGPSPATPWSLV